jgi:hypothetical protein
MVNGGRAVTPAFFARVGRHDRRKLRINVDPIYDRERVKVHPEGSPKLAKRHEEARAILTADAATPTRVVVPTWQVP